MKINRLKKTYYNNNVLDIRDFNFNKQGVLGIIGKNGVGKTTLLKCLSGHLISDEKDIHMEEISFFPSNTDFIGKKILDLIKLMQLTYSDFDSEKFEALIQNNKLEVTMNISSLSRGQKVLLNIALTLSRETKIYFLDEPYSNIDIITTEKVTKLLIDVFDSSNKLLIITSHQFDDIERLLDYITVINNKTIDNPVNVSDVTKNQTLVNWFKESVGGIL